MLRKSLSRRALRLGIFYRVPPDDEDTGGGGGKKKDGPPEKAPSEIVSNLIRRYGSPETALAVLAGENRDYRRRHREDQEALGVAKGKEPKAGMVQMTEADKAELEGFRKLGKLTEVTSRITLAGELEGEKLTREVAETVGWKPNVLKDRIKADNLHVELRDTSVDDGKGGKVTKKLPFARPADKADAQLVALTEYADTNWKDYLPVLKAEGQAGNGTSGVSGLQFPPSITSPANPANGSTGAVKEMMDRMNKRSEGTNPLMTQSTAEKK